MAKKADLERKKELAKYYYMQGESQKTIAAKVDVSEVTISKWVKKDGLELKRAGSNITRPELVNKLLITINDLIDKAIESKDAMQLAGLPDKLSKFAAVIEKLDKKANIVDAIEVFMAFNKWMQSRQNIDEEITAELQKAINKYQDLYITENISK
jgi:transposase-like protein